MLKGLQLKHILFFVGKIFMEFSLPSLSLLEFSLLNVEFHDFLVS